MKPELDPIIEEIHEVRRDIAKRFHGDVHRIAEDARNRQSLEGRPVWRGVKSKAETQAVRRDIGEDTSANAVER